MIDTDSIVWNLLAGGHSADEILKGLREIDEDLVYDVRQRYDEENED